MSRVTWTAPEVTRTDAPLVAGERASLDAFLDYERDTLLTKCAGLTAEQLKQQSVPPSKLSLLGLVRHMADVERWWVRIHGGGQDLPSSCFTPDEPEVDFHGAASADAEADLDLFRREVAAAREAVRGKDLTETVYRPGDEAGPVRDLRWIYVHMIEEYSRHNGHADLIRERIDGVTGE
jgi:uncharacterized damage-inducible protein DinB